MPAEITYWSSRGDGIASPAGLISSETRSTSASSQVSGVTPDAGLVSIVCTTAAIRVAYGPNPTANAEGAYIGVGERIWLTARPGWKLAAINA